MRRRLDVAYLIEHTGRELDVGCLVKHYLRTRHGLEAEVLPVALARRYATLNLDPRLVVLPYAYRATDAYTSGFLSRWKPVPVFNMAWEELLYRAFEAEKMPQDVFTTQHVLHHAWGDFFHEYLRKAGVPSDHVFVNGQPAYMLYREPYRGFWPSRDTLAARHGLDPARRWVLFPENYGWAFYTQARIADLRAGGMAPETIDGLVRYCADSLGMLLGWCADLARTDGVEVIVRPRPATLEADFRRVLDEAVPEAPAHLHVIKEGSIREWILASDVVFSSYSTTLIEAAVAGRAAFMVEPIALADGLVADWYEHVPRVTDREAFLEACHGRGGAASSDTLGRWASATMLARGDPIVGVADHLAAILDGRVTPPPRPPDEALPARYRLWRRGSTGVRGLRDRFVHAARPLVGGWRRSFRVASRALPADRAGHVDAWDVFDASDVDRCTRAWAVALGDVSP